MLHHMMTLTAALLGAALLAPTEAVAQDKTGATWPSPVATRGPVAEKDKKPAPRRTINGMWSALRLGNQSGGVQLKPNNGKPENELPYTPYGLQVYRSHKPLEGIGSVDPADNNDPRTKCEPLGFPRYNHYDLGIQVFQDEHKIAMLYNFDNRWRMIWTDGRPLPKAVDGGVEIDGEYREARWMGYSVGRWIDDYTLEVVTVGTMPEHLREILLLSYFHQFPYKQIGEILGIPLGTVKSRLHAAVAHFADRWKANQNRAPGVAS